MARRSLHLVMVTAVLVACMAAPGMVAPLHAQRSGGDLVVGADVWPTSFDPLLSFGEQDRHYLFQVFDPLIELKPDFSLKPSLATSWEFVNPTTFVLRIRPGVRFHDGTPFNAEAVKFNFERMMKDPASVRKLEVDTVKSVDVIDARTVRINLSAGDAGLPYRLTERPGMMVSPAAVRSFGAAFGSHPVGTGPFKFDSALVNNFARFVRFNGYWDRGLPYLNSVTFKVIATEPVMTQSFETGDLDLLYIVPLADVERIRRNPALVYYGSPGSGVFMLNFNIRVAPFNNRLVRQALNYATDKKAIVASLVHGEAVAGLGPFAPTRGYAFDLTQKGYPFDQTRAKQLLAQAGYPDGFTMTLSVINRTSDIQMGEAIQGMWGDVGVKVTIRPMELIALLNEIKTNPRADPLIRAWQAGSIDPDYDLTRAFASYGFWNVQGYADPTTDAMIKKIRATRGEDQRRVLYAQVTRRIIDEALGVYLFYPNFRMAHRSTVHGFAPMPDWSIRLKSVWKD